VLIRSTAAPPSGRLEQGDVHHIHCLRAGPGTVRPDGRDQQVAGAMKVLERDVPVLPSMLGFLLP
jgi:hypothetical protein